LYDLLKPLIIGGAVWPHIMQENDGRKASNALEKQVEGPNTITTWKAEAYT
jgi:hypothetical protein